MRKWKWESVEVGRRIEEETEKDILKFKRNINETNMQKKVT